jgi:hypothetical protein
VGDIYQFNDWLSLHTTTSHIVDPDKEQCKLQTTQYQRKYRDWPCYFRRSGPNAQPRGSPSPKQFTFLGISSKQTKICYVISQLDQRHAAEVKDIITSPPK